MNSRFISAALCAIILIVAPLAVWAEHTYPHQWQDRLLWADFFPEPDRHTPVTVNGTFLPSIIQGDTTYTANDSPLLLVGETTVAPGATLRLEPGVHIYAHEYASILVEGSILLTGTPQDPILLTTNEAHLENQVWGGVVLTPSSTAQVSHAKFMYASPAVSCMAGSRAAIANTDILFGNSGIFTNSPDCAISNSTIMNSRTGITSINAAVQSTNTAIRASIADIKQVYY